MHPASRGLAYRLTPPGRHVPMRVNLALHLLAQRNLTVKRILIDAKRKQRSAYGYELNRAR